MPLAPAKSLLKTLPRRRRTRKAAHTAATATAVVPDDILATATGKPADKSPRRKQAESRFVRMRNLRTLRLRELAKLGAKDAKDNLRDDKQILYQPRS